MDEIKQLEIIGIKKVSSETHIDRKYLKYMIDCEYDKLSRINTLGFVKILSREYSLNLDNWVEAFEDYWQANRKTEDGSDGLFIVLEDKKDRKKLLFMVLSIIVISLLVLLFFLFKDKVDLNFYQNEVNTNYEQTSVVQDTQKSLEIINEQNNSLLNEINTTKKNDNILSNDKSVQIIKEPTNIVVDLKNSNKDENISLVINTEKLIKDKLPSQKKTFLNEAIFTPKSELWIGVIYLNDYGRNAYLGEGNFSIDLSKNQIITTGHGSFYLHVKDKVREFSRQAPVRLLVKDGNISEISWSEYKALNKGKSW